MKAALKDSPYGFLSQLNGIQWIDHEIIMLIWSISISSPYDLCILIRGKWDLLGKYYDSSGDLFGYYVIIGSLIRNRSAGEWNNDLIWTAGYRYFLGIILHKIKCSLDMVSKVRQHKIKHVLLTKAQLRIFWKAIAWLLYNILNLNCPKRWTLPKEKKYLQTTDYSTKVQSTLLLI